MYKVYQFIEHIFFKYIMEQIFYVKTLREEFDGLQTLIENELITTQTTEEIFKILTLKPNTSSF